MLFGPSAFLFIKSQNYVNYPKEGFDTFYFVRIFFNPSERFRYLCKHIGTNVYKILLNSIYVNILEPTCTKYFLIPFM